LVLPGVIDQCGGWKNKALTGIGIVHICFQPYVIHTMTGVFCRLALWGGALLLLSGILTWFREPLTVEELKCLAMPNINQDWIRGETLCSRQGALHILWSSPMRAPSYWLPNSHIHFFVMFMPYFCEMHSVVTGALFIATGPLLAAWLTPNVNEQASVWCFLSILQICVLTGKLFLPHTSHHQEARGEKDKSL
jgi:hypothetical protein